MRDLILPFLVVVAPQMALATLQHGVSVLAPAFTKAAGLPPEAVGLIGGLSGLGSVWFFAASGAVLPVLGPVRALTMGCLIGVLAASLFAFETGWLIFVAAPLVGFAYAVTAPAGSQLLARHTPRHLWGTLFSLRMAGVPAGGAVAGIAGAGLAAAWDWRAGLAAILVPGLLCALFLTFGAGRMREPRSGGRIRLAAILAPANLATPFRTLRATPGLPLLTFSSLGFAAVQSSTFTFLTTYLTDGLGLSLALAGTLFATMQVASFAGRIGVGFLSALIPVRRTLIALGLLSALGAVLLAHAEPGLPVWALFAGAILIGASVATWNGLFMAEIAAVAGEGDVSGATAAATFFTFIGYMVTPPTFAALAWGFGYSTAYLCAAVCVLTAVFFIARAPAIPRRQT